MDYWVHGDRNRTANSNAYYNPHMLELRMSEPQGYPKQTVLMARALFVVGGAILTGLGAYAGTILPPAIRFLGFGLEVLGALVLGFGAFARGNICVMVAHRLLRLLGK